MDQIIGVRVFVAAVDTGSLAAAGRQLSLSSAMTGRYLASLEEQLKARLLHRSTRHLSLTEAGERYYERCKRILADLDDANREVGDRDKALLGVLRVSAPITFGATHLGDTVSRYLKDHPGVNVDMALSDRQIDLLESGIDVAIRIGELRDDSLTVRRLAACRMVACASPNYLAGRGTPATPSHLRDHACLAFRGATSPGDWTFIGKTGERHIVGGPFRLLADSMDVLRAAALAGSGIAYGPIFAFDDALARGLLVPVLSEYGTVTLPVHAVFPTARYMPRMVRQFVDYLAEDFGGVPPWERWVAS